VAWKTSAKATDKREVGRANLAGLGKRFTTCRVDQAETSTRWFIAQTAPTQGSLQA
jgi:hypothetical protein